MISFAWPWLLLLPPAASSCASDPAAEVKQDLPALRVPSSKILRCGSETGAIAIRGGVLAGSSRLAALLVIAGARPQWLGEGDPSCPSAGRDLMLAVRSVGRYAERDFIIGGQG